MRKPKVIFIGPDCSGKSTLAQAVAKELGVPLSSNRKPQDDLETIGMVATDSLMLRAEGSDDSFVRDQWPFPVDIIYSRTLLHKPSPLESMAELLAAEYWKADVLFLYVTAEPEELVSRYNSRGDELWNIEQILKVAKAYENSFVGAEFDMPMIKINTTTGSIESLVDLTVWRIKKYYNL